MGGLEFIGFGIAFTLGVVVGASIMYFGCLLIDKEEG